MPVLTSQQRKLLDEACVKGRRASEQAVRAALGSLAVTAERPPAHLSEGDRQLRRGLRAKSRQLGDQSGKLDLLVAECAYEQWHRLLFARFLAENNLLMDPASGAPVELEDCEDLADSLGEPDGWAVAGRFAAEILPGIFRLEDPCVQLRLAPEGRLALEGIVAGLQSAIFSGDDALGWVYQYWQKEQKDSVNRSERRIGGADIGPVTQLFTENYMVRFLLENSLGAWWYARRPDSPLIKNWEYLRFDDGLPAAGTFDGWPSTVAGLTMMDPCCGSGHFLVEAFGMLWRMRAEEEELDVVAAQDAVLRDNLFGLELDARCVQIATFAVLMQAWKSGGGWRELPVPNIGCAGVPVRASSTEWATLAGENDRLAEAVVRLHVLFRNADTLGSLIDPKRVAEVTDPKSMQRSFTDVEWSDVSPLIQAALRAESDDPAMKVLGVDAMLTARAAELLSRNYTLIATNPPFLGRAKQGDTIRTFLERWYSSASADLSTAFLMRCIDLLSPHGCLSIVTPDTWRFIPSFAKLRDDFLDSNEPRLIASLGSRPFRAQLWDYPICLTLAVAADSANDIDRVPVMTVEATPDTPQVLITGSIRRLPIDAAIRGGRARSREPRLSDYATPYEGLSTGDGGRFTRFWWEIPPSEDWDHLQVRPEVTGLVGGAEECFLWEKGSGVLAGDPGARIQGLGAWGKSGVLVERQIGLRATAYLGTAFFKTSVAIIPHRESDLPALWHFCSSDGYREAVRERDPRVGIATSATVDVQFDIDHWRDVAAAATDTMAPLDSGDPRQWLCDGSPETATEPLQVGVGRLLGYRWPKQFELGDLDELGDEDGIVCLPSVRGERTATDRLQELLARAFGGTWSPARTQDLLSASDSKKPDLDAWLRDDFFRAHCQLFKSRPFVWQIWDGRKDGFSALVNYHRFDRSTLEKLTYSYLGDWIERQVAGVRDDVAGAEDRLAAARALQQKLKLILEGEPPYDIYVRWKSLPEQPIGWDPDLNDGVRLNVRPFVEAGVLRSRFGVKWDKDRGKNPDGSERLNDLHFTKAQKRAARGSA